MMKRRKWSPVAGFLSLLVVVAVAVSLAVAGCAFPGIPWHTDQRDTVRSADAALKAVFADQDSTGDWRLAGFPRTPRTVAGQIPRGGPGTVWIDGAYETKVVREGPDWLISLTESWDAKDFRESHSPSTGTLSHTWQVKVDATTGQVSWPAPAGTGDFPPQLVR